MYRFLLFLLPIFLLCRCASKHQPLVYSPYFAVGPEEALTHEVLRELADLESREDELNPLQKKRLFDLLQIEKKNLSSSSTRAKGIDEKLEVLKGEVKPLLVDTSTEGALEPETQNQSSKEKQKFSIQELKKPFQKAHEAWNRDENEKALDLIEKLMSSEIYQQKADSADKKRVMNLYFRAAFDAKNFEKCQKAYEALKLESSCSKEAAQTGFLLALLKFADGKRTEARSLLIEQCDPDQTISNRIRRVYWLFRMSDDQSVEQQKYYEQLASFPLPGYYLYLAQQYRGKDFNLPKKVEMSFEDFSVSRSANGFISMAEERLQFGLRKDAVKLLRMAQQELMANPEANISSLLYISRLFQAAGNHLEAMKTINLLMTGEGSDQITKPIANSESELASEFMNLYHRPHREQVEWFGRLWGVDPDFIYSIMRQESAFNPGAVSVAGARGLMQLMPVLSKFLMEQWRTPFPVKKGYLFLGPENIKIATYHLHQLNQIAPHPALVAASYNAGIYRVSSWWKRTGHYPLDIFVEFIPINETRNYVKLVLRNLIYYKGLKNQGTVPKDIISQELPLAPATLREPIINS